MYQEDIHERNGKKKLRFSARDTTRLFTSCDVVTKKP